MSAAQGAAIAVSQRGALLRAFVATLLALVGLLLLVVVPLALTLNQPGGELSVPGLPAGARPFVAIYEDAATVYRVNPFLLMAVHEDETDYGRSTLPGVRSGLNSAGCCAGPMQFSVSGTAFGGSGGTWASYRLAYRRATRPRPAGYPNRFSPHPNVYDSFDSIYAAAAYVRSLGAGLALNGHSFQALVRYKGVPPASIPYARKDFERAKELERLARQGAGSVPMEGVPIIPGTRARLLANGLAAAPASAPPAVKGMVAAANDISDRPYLLRHYPTHIGNPTYDCSSAVSHVLWGGRRFGTAPWISGSLMRYGSIGPGRWTSVYANSGHTFIYVAGLRFDTSRYGGGPTEGESGPRWRLGQRPVAGFVVRHPAGL